MIFIFCFIHRRNLVCMCIIFIPNWWKSCVNHVQTNLFVSIATMYGSVFLFEIFFLLIVLHFSLTFSTNQHSLDFCISGGKKAHDSAFILIASVAESGSETAKKRAQKTFPKINYVSFAVISRLSNKIDEDTGGCSSLSRRGNMNSEIRKHSQYEKRIILWILSICSYFLLILWIWSILRMRKKWDHVSQLNLPNQYLLKLENWDSNFEPMYDIKLMSISEMLSREW